MKNEVVIGDESTAVVTEGKTFVGTAKKTATWETEIDGYAVSVKKFAMAGVADEYAWSVKPIGEKAMSYNSASGYATTIKGAKSSVSKAINKLKVVK